MKYNMEQNAQANTNIRKTLRNSSFELLRIIAIVFIIAHHFCVHGGFDYTEFGNSALILFNRTWINFLSQFGRVGVNLFVLISAFFMVDNTRFRIKKIISIIFEVLTFSVILGLIFLFYYHKALTLSLIRTIIFPLGSETWWFITLYLILYIISPFLNVGIKGMNKKMHILLIVFFICIWSIFPTFLRIDYEFSLFGWFVVLYLIASYIRIYDVSISCKPLVGILISSLIFIFWFLIKCAIKYFFPDDSQTISELINWFNLIEINNVVQVLGTIILFLSFKKARIKSSRLINLIASTTLAIYLFHDHFDVSNYLWVDLFKISSFATSPFLFLYSLGVIAVVFVVGVFVGLFYRYTFCIIYNKFLCFLDKKWLNKLDDCFNKNDCEQV